MSDENPNPESNLSHEPTHPPKQNQPEAQERQKEEQRVLSCAEDLERRYNRWEAKALQTRTALYRILGKIHVESPFVRANEHVREALVSKAMQTPGIQGRRWDGRTVPVQEVFVTLLTKIDEKTKSAKCRYTAVLLNAEREGVGPTVDAFVTWISDKGGITEAGRLSPGKKEKEAEDGGISSASPPFDLNQFLASIRSPSFPAKPIDLDVAETQATEEGLILLLVDTKAPLEGGRPAIVAELAQEKLIRAAAREIEHGRFAELSEAQKRDCERQQALWALNKVALKLARKVKEKVTSADVKAFREAQKHLWVADAAEKLLFEGAAGVTWHHDDKNDFISLEVLHPEYHLLDPGRYMQGARKGALVPYDLEGGDEAVRAYVRRQTQPWLYLEEQSAEGRIGDPLSQNAGNESK